jgi:hypothetical protein
MEEPKAPLREERKSVSSVILNRPPSDEDARLAMALRISERFHLPIERVYRMLGGMRAG